MNQLLPVERLSVTGLVLCDDEWKPCFVHAYYCPIDLIEWDKWFGHTYPRNYQAGIAYWRRYRPSKFRAEDWSIIGRSTYYWICMPFTWVIYWTIDEELKDRYAPYQSVKMRRAHWIYYSGNISNGTVTA